MGSLYRPRMIELRIGRSASRSAGLTAAEARRVAEALMQEVAHDGK